MDRIKVSSPNEKPERWVEWDEDLCTMTTAYVDEIRTLSAGCELHVEKRMEFTEYVSFGDSAPPGVGTMEEQFGTIDAHWLRAIDAHEKGEIFEIVICDLKTGYKFVATDSSQLKIYALSVLLEYQLSHDITQVRLMIFQPRHGGMREEVISVADLLAFAETLREGARRVAVATQWYEPMRQKDNLDAWAKIHLNPNPNEEDCAFCRALATCPASRAKLEEVVGSGFDVVIEEVNSLDAAVSSTQMAASDTLGKMMAVTGFLEDWIKAVRAEVERRLMLGEPVEGYGLELGRQGARAWTDKAAVEELIRKRFRIKAELAYKMELHNPTQIEKLAKPPKPNAKHPTAHPKVINDTQWERLQAFIMRSDPVPSVKPLAQIKTPYSVVKADSSAFDVVDDGEQLW